MRKGAAIALYLTVALAFVTFAGGCSSSSYGNQNLTQDNVSKIVKGVTTREQIITLFGEPTNVSMLADGRRLMMYQGFQGSGNKSGRMLQTAIPFGGLVPVSETHTAHRESLQVFLRSDSVVQDFEFADNTSQTKTTASVFGAHTEQTTPVDAANK
jgi:hypothetical protein